MQVPASLQKRDDDGYLLPAGPVQHVKGCGSSCSNRLSYQLTVLRQDVPGIGIDGTQHIIPVPIDYVGKALSAEHGGIQDPAEHVRRMDGA